MGTHTLTQRDNAFDAMVVDGSLTIGPHTYGRPYIKRHAHDDISVQIGGWCSISDGVSLLPGGNHPMDRVSTFPFAERLNLPGAYDGMPYSKGPLIIGNDVWIGRGAVILGGLTIGHGAIVGANALVASNVAPFTIVAGNPARPIRARFPDEVVAQLLADPWWDLPAEDIIELATSGLLVGTDVPALLAEVVRRRLLPTANR